MGRSSPEVCSSRRSRGVPGQPLRGAGLKRPVVATPLQCRELLAACRQLLPRDRAMRWLAPPRRPARTAAAANPGLRSCLAWPSRSVADGVAVTRRTCRRLRQRRAMSPDPFSSSTSNQIATPCFNRFPNISHRFYCPLYLAFSHERYEDNERADKGEQEPNNRNHPAHRRWCNIVLNSQIPFAFLTSFSTVFRLFSLPSKMIET